MPKEFNAQHFLTPARASALLSQINTMEGFVEFRDSAGAQRVMSALPVRSWRLALDAQGFEAAIRDIERHWGQFFGSGGEPAGGVFGSLFYEAGQCTVAGLPAVAGSPGSGIRAGGGYVGLYTWQLTIPEGHPTGDARPATLSFHPDCDRTLYEQILALAEQSLAPLAPFAMTSPFRMEQSPAHYLKGVRQVLDYIHAGDCYQVNLSNKYTGQWRGQPYRAFDQLVAAVPVPYAAYLNTGEIQVLSISPELFLGIRDRQVVTKPIKGTRPRDHAVPETDRTLAAELASASKDRAENLMIVDLLRNDLSRFCQPFSVKVTRLFDVESYQNVHQLVSTVEGTLQDELSPLRALLSAFPGGSITGAPKRRAMEIIRELEPHGRGPYCGSLFRWDFRNNLESNIAIRTLMTESDGTIHCWAGCGIVADSDPQEEYQESVTKVRTLMDVLQAL